LLPDLLPAAFREAGLLTDALPEAALPEAGLLTSAFPEAGLLLPEGLFPDVLTFDVVFPVLLFSDVPRAALPAPADLRAELLSADLRSVLFRTVRSPEETGVLRLCSFASVSDFKSR